MYLIAMRRISFLLSFLSGGWVGTSFLSSAYALVTFCCRHLSRLLVNILRTIRGGVDGIGMQAAEINVCKIDAQNCIKIHPEKEKDNYPESAGI